MYIFFSRNIMYYRSQRALFNDVRIIKFGLLSMENKKC